MTESTFMKENLRPPSLMSSFSNGPHHYTSNKEFFITER